MATRNVEDEGVLVQKIDLVYVVCKILPTSDTKAHHLTVALYVHHELRGGERTALHLSKLLDETFAARNLSQEYTS